MNKTEKITVKALHQKRDEWAQRRDNEICRFVYRNNYVNGIELLSNGLYLIHAGSIADDPEKVEWDTEIIVEWLDAERQHAAPVGSEGAGEANSFWEPYHEMCETLRKLADEYDFGAGKLDELVARNYRKLQAENARLQQTLKSLLDALDNEFTPPNPVQFPRYSDEYALDIERQQARQALNAASDSAGE